MIEPVDQGLTTSDVQRHLDELQREGPGSAAEPAIRALVGRAVDRLHILSSSLLYRSYPRLTRGPLNLQSEELLSGVVERLMKALVSVHPENVRQFFALANQHMRWELNDLARRLDEKETLLELRDSVPVPEDPSGDGDPTPNLQRMLQAIEELPDGEREVFNLVRVQGMTHLEAANTVGVSCKTVQRRLARSTMFLEEKLGGLIGSRATPGESGGESGGG